MEKQKDAFEVREKGKLILWNYINALNGKSIIIFSNKISAEERQGKIEELEDLGVPIERIGVEI